MSLLKLFRQLVHDLFSTLGVLRISQITFGDRLLSANLKKRVLQNGDGSKNKIVVIFYGQSFRQLLPGVYKMPV